MTKHNSNDSKYLFIDKTNYSIRDVQDPRAHYFLSLLKRAAKSAYEADSLPEDGPGRSFLVSSFVSVAVPSSVFSPGSIVMGLVVGGPVGAAGGTKISTSPKSSPEAGLVGVSAGAGADEGAGGT